MIEALFSVAVIGFATGFLFSIPAAGPIMIIVISNGLKGRLRFCQRVSYGAALADFVYAFVAIYAFARLYSLYEPYIPYVLAAGALFLIILGIKIMRTKLDLENMDDSDLMTDKLRNKGGFRIGLAINFLNPALFVGWLATAFVMLSLASAIGMPTGGLNVQLLSSVQDIGAQGIDANAELHNSTLGDVMSHFESSASQIPNKPSGSTLVSSLIFAAMLAVGSTAWFYLLSKLVVRHRNRFKIKTVERIVQLLAIILLILGLYFAVQSISGLFDMALINI